MLNKLLKEDGDKILQEDGFNILLEQESIVVLNINPPMHFVTLGANPEWCTVQGVLGLDNCVIRQNINGDWVVVHEGNWCERRELIDG